MPVGDAAAPIASQAVPPGGCSGTGGGQEAPRQPSDRWAGLRRGWVEPAAGMLLLLWAVFQNFWNLAAANVEVDETVYVKAGWQYVHGDFRLNGEHPFTAKYLMGIAQLILGQGLTSARTAAAVASLVTGVIIWWWLRTEVGRTTGMLAAAMWLLLPRQISLFWGPREDRYALLEPFMMMFGVAAMAAGWWWYRSGRWSPMVLAGGDRARQHEQGIDHGRGAGAGADAAVGASRPADCQAGRAFVVIAAGWRH